MVKRIILGLGFIFIPTIFSFAKAQVFPFDINFFKKFRFFQNSGFFLNSDFFRNSGLFFFFKTQRFFKTQGFFLNSDFFQNWDFFLKSSLNNVHVIYLLTMIAGSKKMNKIALMIKMVLSVFCFTLCLSCGTSIMPPYIPVTSGNCDRNSSIECYFNLDWLTAAW